MSITDFAASANASAPRHLGQRYNAQRFLPEAGNTVVCHLDRDAPAHRAVLDARARLQAMPGAERFLFTPESSVHMTVFEGALSTRRIADAWPADMDLDAPMDNVTKALRPRLEAFAPPPRFAVRAAGVLPTGLVLAGATEVDERVMRDWREALTVPFGYRHPRHDAYRFHMTFAYPLDWIPDADLAEWDAGLVAILAELQEAAPTIPLKTPAFCRFADMTHFEELVVLG